MPGHFRSINFGTLRTESFISLPHNGQTGCSSNDRSRRIQPLHDGPVHVQTSASVSFASSCPRPLGPAAPLLNAHPPFSRKETINVNGSQKMQEGTPPCAECPF